MHRSFMAALGAREIMSLAERFISRLGSSLGLENRITFSKCRQGFVRGILKVPGSVGQGRSERVKVLLARCTPAATAAVTHAARNRVVDVFLISTFFGSDRAAVMATGDLVVSMCVDVQPNLTRFGV